MIDQRNEKVESYLSEIDPASFNESMTQLILKKSNIPENSYGWHRPSGIEEMSFINRKQVYDIELDCYVLVDQVGSEYKIHGEIVYGFLGPRDPDCRSHNKIIDGLVIMPLHDQLNHLVLVRPHSSD